MQPLPTGSKAKSWKYYYLFKKLPELKMCDGIKEAIPPSPHGVPRTSLFCSAYRVPRKILLAYQILCARLLASNMSNMHVEMPYKHGPMINVCYRAYPVLLMLFLLFNETRLYIDQVCSTTSALVACLV